MERLVIKSAKRTDDNSPAIYRWGRGGPSESSPRSGRQNGTEPRAVARGFKSQIEKRVGTSNRFSQMSARIRSLPLPVLYLFRPFHGLTITRRRQRPSSELLGYFPSSASRTEHFGFSNRRG